MITVSGFKIAADPVRAIMRAVPAAAGRQSLDHVSFSSGRDTGQVEGWIMKLIGYIRVSTDGQLDGYGLDVQETALKAWAKANGHRIVRIERDEGVSGTTAHEERPGLSAALADIADGEADGLLIPRLDRLARAVATQEAALAHVWHSGGRVFATDSGEILQDDPDDPVRTAMRLMIGVFAQLERDMIAKRLRDGRAAKRAAGRKSTGAYAFGSKGTGKGRERDAGPHSGEQAAIARMLELHAAGEPYRAICTALDAEGFKPRRSESWSPMTVRRIVLRAKGQE